jgi:TatD DNase family protein
VLVDTHCHLGDARYDGDRAAVVERARAAGVSRVVVIADTLASSDAALEIARRFGLWATAGVHPHHAGEWSDDAAARVAGALDEPQCVAVGETGLDYHYDYAPREAQRRAFAAQLALAADAGKPVVVHAREADDDVAAMLRDAAATVVLHSFAAGTAVLEAALAADGYVSFSGMITFKSWRRPELVRDCPADRLLVETDAPYLAPHPHRGKRNEPAFVRLVAERVAEIRSMPFDKAAALTTANAERCFGPALRPHPTTS